MSAITTHILDTSLGRPAGGVVVVLEIQLPDGSWKIAGRGVSDLDGRVRNLLPEGYEASGIYRLTFETGDYFAERDVKSFYPSVTVTFSVSDTSQHYHVPLLLGPYGYTTYRGS
jgi:5-hydroxyisourate hydrolase